MKVILPIGYREDPTPDNASFIKDVEISKLSTPATRKVNKIMNKASRGDRQAAEKGISSIITECCQIGDINMDRQFHHRGVSVSAASMLPSEDRMFLIVEIRKMTLGSSKISTAYMCQFCNKITRFRGDDAEDLNDLAVTWWKSGEEKTSVRVVLEDDPFIFMDKEYREMEFGLIYGYMDELLFQKFGDEESSKDGIGMIQFYIQQTFQGFADAKPEVNKDILETSIDLISQFQTHNDFFYIRDTFRSETPGIDIRAHEMSCNFCGENMDEDFAKFDMGRLINDFFTGLDRGGKRNTSRRQVGSISPS